MGGGAVRGAVRHVARTRAPERGAGPLQVEGTEAKLFRPPIRAGTVRRNELVERLRASDTASVVAITAPAGYGKTTLLAEWAERGKQLREPPASLRHGLGRGDHRARRVRQDHPARRVGRARWSPVRMGI